MVALWHDYAHTEHIHSDSPDANLPRVQWWAFEMSQFDSADFQSPPDIG